MARRLKDISIHEISLVDFPANRRPFAIIKHEEKQMEELKALIEKFTGQELDEETISKMGLEKDGLEALKKQLELLDKYRDDLPPAAVEAIGAMSQQAAFGITKADEDEPDKDKDVNAEEFITQVVEATLEKAGAKFSKDTKKMLDDLLAKVDALNKVVEGIKDKMAIGKSGDDPDREVTPEEIAKAYEARIAKLVS